MIHIIRDIKLSKLTGISLNGEASKFIRFWNKIWCDMKIHVDADKGEIKCWKEGYDYYYFRQDNKNDNLWCDFEKVWSLLQYDSKFTYTETQELIQYMVNETLNYVVNTPRLSYKEINQKVYVTLNCVVNTPVYEVGMNIIAADKTLNCVVNTPRYRQ